MTRSKKNTTGKPTTATQLSPMMIVAEVAELLGFGQNFVYRLVSKPGFPAVKVGNSYRIFREGLMEWLDAQKVNNTPEVLHNMWDPEVAPYPAGGKLENTIINMKKEIKMSFLKDVSFLLRLSSITVLISKMRRSNIFSLSSGCLWR